MQLAQFRRERRNTYSGNGADNTKAFLISFSGLNCVIGEDGRQSAHHNVCCPRGWVEHDQPGWNEPFREYFPEFLCDLPRTANPNYSDFVGDARCGRIRNHERLVNSPRRSRVCSRANESILIFFLRKNNARLYSKYIEYICKLMFEFSYVRVAKCQEYLSRDFLYSRLSHAYSINCPEPELEVLKIVDQTSTMLRYAYLRHLRISYRLK